MDLNRQKTGYAKRTALSGILIALTVIVLYAESVLPTSKLSLYALSSFFSAVIILVSGVRSAWIFYVTASLLAFIIIPDKIGLIPYFIFFGLYGIIKFYIEKLRRLAAEYILKLLYFNICLAAAIFIIQEFMPGTVTAGYPLWVIIAGLELAFVAYDYAFTLFIQYFNRKLIRFV